VALGLMVAMLMRSLSGLPDERGRRTFGFTTGIYNYGFFPYPIAAALFDRETLGVTFVHNVGVEVAIWTLGVAVVSATDWRQSWRKILNGPVVAIVGALILNRVGFHPGEGNVLRVMAHSLGQCAIPLGLLQIGGTIAEHVNEFGPRRHPGDLVWSCLIRLLLLPVMFLLLARWLPISVELKRVMLLQAAMPCAVFPIVMTAKYGGDTVVALRVVLSTTLVGLVTMPLWIKVGLKWLHLGS
jgi:malate permease and related proteins